MHILGEQVVPLKVNPGLQEPAQISAPLAVQLDPVAAVGPFVQVHVFATQLSPTG